MLSFNANEPLKLTSFPSITGDLNNLHILKYIKQEQKALDSEPLVLLIENISDVF